MKLTIRTLAATTVGTALLGAGFVGTAQAAPAPNACAGVAGCSVVSSADVDGDGVNDSVGLKVWGSGSDGKKVTTRVATADGEKMQIVTQTSRSMSTAADHYRGAARIDGEDGYEVVVLTDLGAHTGYYQVLTYRDGSLRSLKDPRNRWRWVTDGSVWSSYGYQRTTTAAGALKMVTREGVDSDRDGDFTQTTYSNGWKNGAWVRMSQTKRYDVRASVAHRYEGWHVPYLAKGI